MVRVEELPNNVFSVHCDDRVQYVHDLETFKPDVYHKYTILHAADMHVIIDKVGIRINENTYWVTEGEESFNDDVDIVAMLYTIERTKILESGAVKNHEQHQQPHVTTSPHVRIDGVASAACGIERPADIPAGIEHDGRHQGDREDGLPSP